MSAQRYTSPNALSRMASGLCPECGNAVVAHSNDIRFWVPRTCDLTIQGVVDRIEQFKADRAEATA